MKGVGEGYLHGAQREGRKELIGSPWTRRSRVVWTLVGCRNLVISHDDVNR